VQTAASGQPIYGVAWFSARTDVDKERRLVTLEDIRLNASAELERQPRWCNALTSAAL
jgi:hypothetical protein